MPPTKNFWCHHCPGTTVYRPIYAVQGLTVLTFCAQWMAGGGCSFLKIVRGCACRTSKIWLSLYQFFAKFPTHQYTIFERKAPNLDQIGCFLQIFTQNTPNLCNLGSFVSDENPPIARPIPNFAKKCPKRQAHIRIPSQCENPPGDGWPQLPFQGRLFSHDLV